MAFYGMEHYEALEGNQVYHFILAQKDFHDITLSGKSPSADYDTQWSYDFKYSNSAMCTF